MIHEIHAKSLLQKCGAPSQWFNIHYNMNIYRGCQHGCVYCDSRSDCYRIENFDTDITVKINALDLLEKELKKKDNQLTVGTGAMCDPYMPIEKKYRLTQKALELIEKYNFPINIITKSDLILRDIDILAAINKKRMATVGITLTTVNDELAKKLEPHAPLPSKRVEALKFLSKNRINTGVLLMPVLPFIEDDKQAIIDIIEAAKEANAKFIIAYFGMTIRAGQREYFYDKLDEHFPLKKQKYIQTFKDSYSCNTPNSKELYALFSKKCEEYGIIYKMKNVPYYFPIKEQLSLF